MPSPLTVNAARGLFALSAGTALADNKKALSAYQAKNYAVALQEWSDGAAAGNAEAQYWLGVLYREGHGTDQNYAEAIKWFERSADQYYSKAQSDLGYMYDIGLGTPQNPAKAVQLYTRAAQQGLSTAQFNLGNKYVSGVGVGRDHIEGLKWLVLSEINGQTTHKDVARKRIDEVKRLLTEAQIAEAQSRAQNWQAAKTAETAPVQPGQRRLRQATNGTGFLVTRDGNILTSHHNIDNCVQVRVGFTAGTAVATVVGSDTENDIALLRSDLAAAEVPTFRPAQEIRLGEDVVVFGFPLRGILASSGNLSTGVVSAMAGPRDDARYIQLTAPVQRGNSGGAVLDRGGNVIGLITSKLDVTKVEKLRGDVAQNVNFALRVSLLRRFLDSHRVAYANGAGRPTVSVADVAERAVKFTIVVECWR